MQSGEATGTKRASRGRRCATRLLSGSAFLLAMLGPAEAQEAPPAIRNNYGSLGLIDMPSARMAPGGAIATGASFQKNIQHYNFSFQPMPWFEGGFSYSGLSHYDPAYPVYWDRSFSAKLRLWDESYAFPAVAIGVNDLVGTGIYAGEYLVASKQLGPFDATIGIGWGRNATGNKFRNPLGLISKSFDTRIYDAAIGQTNTAYFKGPAGLFGGITWQTPIDNLTVVAEYSSDSYYLEFTRTFTPRNQYNFGLSYKALDLVTLGLNYIYGDSINASISFALDPVTNPFPARIGPTLPPVRVRTELEQQQALNNLIDERSGAARRAMAASQSRSALVDALWSDGLTDVALHGRALEVNAGQGDAMRLCQATARLAARHALTIDRVAVHSAGKTQTCDVPVQAQPAVYVSAAGVAGLALAPPSLTTIDASMPAAPPDAGPAIREEAARQNIAIQALSLTGSEAIVYYSNNKYRQEKDAVDRLVRILMANAPPNIEKIRLLPTMNSQPVNEYEILRGPTERALSQEGGYSLVRGGNAIKDAPLQNPILAQAGAGTFPRFSWRLFPQIHQELFDPNNPFGIQFLAGVQGSVELLPGLLVVGEGEYSLYDNFETTRASDSVLPHVRTDWVRFFTEGKNGLGELDAQYNFRLAPDVSGVVRAGMLESMFAGVGGEVLWKPQGQRWALGADLFGVQERSFDRLLGLQDYKVVTGHVSLYYDSPWYDLNFALRAGQYLAGDRGVTFEVSRRFATGVEIGIFFTKTNVSAEQFGEGSFDKGFMISIPIDWSLPVQTQASLSTTQRPLQRDGGQRLTGDATLYDRQRRTSYGEIMRSGDIAAP